MREISICELRKNEVAQSSRRLSPDKSLNEETGSVQFRVAPSHIGQPPVWSARKKRRRRLVADLTTVRWPCLSETEVTAVEGTLTCPH